MSTHEKTTTTHTGAHPTTAVGTHDKTTTTTHTSTHPTTTVGTHEKTTTTTHTGAHPTTTVGTHDKTTTSHTGAQENSNLVQMAQTVQKGEIPSTHQIQSELKPTQHFLAQKEKESVSLEKEQAYHRTRKFLESFETLLVEKNVADKMNNLLLASKRLNDNTTAANNTTAVARESRKFALEMKDLIPDLVKSKSFRASVMDLFKVMRDVFMMKQRQYKGTENPEKVFVEGHRVENKSGETHVVVEAAKHQHMETTSTGHARAKGHEIPEEHKRRIRENIKVLFSELNKKPSTSIAFQKFLNLWEMLNTELQHQRTQKDVNDQHVKEVQLAVREIVEAFTGRSLSRFIKLLRKSNDVIQNDDKLQSFLKDFRSYLRRGLEHPEIIDNEKFIQEGNEIIDRGSKLADKYYENETLNDLADEAQILVESIKTDDHLQDLKYRAGKVADAFTYTDVAGTTHVDTDLISQMRADLVPFLIERIRDIPLPPIRIENQKKFEYLVVENLKVRIEDIMPDRIQIKSKNNMDITPLDFDTNAHTHTAIRFRMEGMRPEFHDFTFRFKRTGMIKLEDEGRANLIIAGTGINVDIEFDVDIDDRKRLRLNTSHVTVNVGTVKLEVIEAEHKGLLKMLSGFIAPTMKTQLENTLRTRFEEMGAQWATIINKRILSAAPMGNLNLGTNIKQAVNKIPGVGGDSEKKEEVREKVKERVKDKVNEHSSDKSTTHTEGDALAGKTIHVHVHDDKAQTKHVP